MADPLQCRVLFEVVSSKRGSICLGRLVNQDSASPVVILRELLGRESSANRAREMARALDLARGLSHPKLLNTLGIAVSEDRVFVASEYVPGVCLSELILAVRSQRRGMLATAAVRVILDALELTLETRALGRPLGLFPGRQFFPENVWITELGETMLTEAGTSHLPNAAPGNRSTSTNPESQDAWAAAVELFHLASARLLTGDVGASARQFLSASLARALERALSLDPSSQRPMARELADSLARLPPALLGTEALVAEELGRLVPDILDARQRLVSSGASYGPTVERAPKNVGRAALVESDTDEEATLAMRPLERRTERAPRPLARSLRVALTHSHERRRLLPLVERALLAILLVLVVTTGVLAARNPDRVRGLLDYFRHLAPSSSQSRR